ncbi:MAG: hypothetical protein A2161_10275 [Candidatus Schekmanbacteria bacterium RBG_13_48_7]|uniref:histidine kinase n=1 Tax=Candidatus Schekmanbacteria bacterium RBG_13_48_7 TaxID=1817878 RepID=A0A1F7S2M3_9BACT|nr:MAG: hypothetical protein A2161_10275 [Candidatus Schekmanbacteria bacterium RBG_13_48_7]
MQEKDKHDQNFSSKNYEVLDSIPIGIFILSEDYTVLFWNKCIEGWTNISSDGIVGQAITEFFPDLKSMEYTERLRDIFKGGPSTIFSSPFHNSIISAASSNDQIRFHHTIVSPMRTETGIHALFALQDVTELKLLTNEYEIMRDKAAQESKARQQKEVELRWSDEKYHKLYQQSADGILIHDPSGKILNVNNAFLNLIGYTESEILSMNLRELFHQDVKETLEQVLMAIIRTEHTRFEISFLKKNETLFPAEISAAIIELKGRKVIQYIIRDISERKHIELMKNEFISIVSHELRTPLTSILGSLKLIMSGMDEPTTKSNLLDIAYRNSERLVKLVNDILDIEKIESNNMEFINKPIEIMHFVEKTIEANQAYGKQFGIKFVLQKQLPGVLVNADSDKLTQVLTNLLSNAAKFSPHNDVVEISVFSHNESVRVAIKDNGPGIPEEFQSRIFDKFAQAGSPINQEIKGTGLGLSICKAIIEKLNGRIGFEVMKTKGTVFFFDLPVWCEKK